ncbi:MAG: hypothetical protein L0Y71_00005 [Gemmataceae bacterium]|nr:hypothetical protein [Gemmataceae bacterium]
MNRYVLYAYVDGADNAGIEAEIETSLRAFVAGRAWKLQPPIVVNQRRPDDPSLGPNDLPDWELGLNLDLPALGSEPQGWFSDVEAVATFLAAMHDATGREFVIGIGDRETGITDDLFFVDCSNPDLATLRQVIGE